jgi:hypothetical protein
MSVGVKLSKKLSISRASRAGARSARCDVVDWTALEDDFRGGVWGKCCPASLVDDGEVSMLSSGRRRELCRPASGEYIVERGSGQATGNLGLGDRELEHKHQRTVRRHQSTAVDTENKGVAQAVPALVRLARSRQQQGESSARIKWMHVMGNH